MRRSSGSLQGKANSRPRTKACSISSTDLPNGLVEIDSGTARLEIVAPTGVTLYVNEVPSSYVDIADPGFLAFEYFQQMDAVLQALHPEPEPVKALHLGAAGCSLAWAWNTTRPGSRQVAVDIDAALVNYVRQWFPLPTAPALRIRAQNAAEAVATARPGSYDVVVRDVFQGDITPAELTTIDFDLTVATILKPNGLYLANCADRKPLALVKQEVKNLLSTFDAVAMIGEKGVLSGRRYGNFVLAAALGSPDQFSDPMLARALRSLPTPADIITAGELAAFFKIPQNHARVSTVQIAQPNHLH